MSQSKSYLPEGQRSVTPHLLVSNGLEAIAFYEKAFGAELRYRVPGPTPGSTLHAEIRIGDSAVYLMDMSGPARVKAPGTGSVNAGLTHVFVPDCDAVVNRAVAAGAKIVMPVSDQMWGDRYGQIEDPFGQIWSVATHKEDVSADELERRTKTFFAQMSGQG